MSALTVDLVESQELAAMENSLADQIARLRQDPLAAIERGIEDLGFAAQRDAFWVALLSCVSAAAESPFSVLLVGNPASGKSTVASAVANLVGPDFVVSTSSLSHVTAAAASRLAERLTHHCLVCDERASNGAFDGLWRQALSGRPASQIITLQGEPVELTVMPPISSVEAVLTDKEMSPQDRSRYLRIRLREDEEASLIIRALARQSGTVEGRRRQHRLDVLSQACQVFLVSLRRDLFVHVPFAGQIALDDNGFAIRTEQQIIRATQTVAWLCQHGRAVSWDEDAGDFIQATPADYRLVWEILLRSGEDGSVDLSDNALLVFRTWKQWVAAHGDVPRSRLQMDDFLKPRLSTWQVYHALAELIELGLADGPVKRGVRCSYRLTDLGRATQRPNAFQSLPRPGDLQA